MVEVLLLIVGMAMLIIGANWFVDGSSVIARSLKISPLIIGLTLVSMGTSAPEASVSITSSIEGMSDMSLGNVVGSNVFNTLLILGISTVIVPLAIDKDMKKFDIPIMLGCYVVLILFAFVITPYSIDLFEGIILLVLFVGFTAFLIVRAKRKNSATANGDLMPALEKPSNTTANATADTDAAQISENSCNTTATAEMSAAQISENSCNNATNATADTEAAHVAEKPSKFKWQKPKWLRIVLTFVGLAGIIFGGRFVVDNAAIIAKSLGMSEVLVGLTIVAVGTSLPELVTSVVASIKKENEIAVGNVVGSNIFNTIFILGISSSISAIPLDISVLVDMLIMLGSGILLLVLSFTNKKLLRIYGVMFILMYAGYLTYIIIRN